MQIQIQTNANANRVDKYRSIYWRKKLCSFPEEKTQQPGSKIRNSELKKRKNQFSSCTKVGISFDDDGKTDAISNKQFKASHKNARNEEEKESAQTWLYPERALPLTGMNKNDVSLIHFPFNTHQCLQRHGKFCEFVTMLGGFKKFWKLIWALLVIKWQRKFSIYSLCFGERGFLSWWLSVFLSFCLFSFYFLKKRKKR